MARQFLTGLNLNKNELLNARVQNLANDPSSPVLGQIYFNTSANELRVYNGTEFEAVGINGITASAAEINILDGATLTTTELNYVDGVTSAIQTQLDAKAPSDFPTFTGNVLIDGGDIVFTTGSNTTTLDFGTPTADSTIAVPNKDGTLILSSSTVNDLTAPTASFSMNSNKITNLATPTAATDAATKGYVDGVAQGLDIKASVRAASTQVVELGGGINATSVIDGVTLADGDRVLIKNQNTWAENGIYVFNSVNEDFTRATDADSGSELSGGTFVFVEEGTTQADTGWVISSNGAITIGTDDIEWTQFSGAGAYQAGDGLTLTGSTFAVGGTTNRIQVNSDSIDIDANYTGQNSITTVGTIAAGTWQATDIAVAHGGTGASTAAGAKTNLGFMTRYAANNILLVPSSGIVSWTVTHNLGTKDVTVQVYDLATDAEVFVDVVRTSTSVVTLSWVASANVTADSYRVVVIG